jgi:hypothetical protein
MKTTLGNPSQSASKPLSTGLQFSLFDPRFRERPHEYRTACASDPAHQDTGLGRLFATRFEDVKSVLSDASLFVNHKCRPIV